MRRWGMKSLRRWVCSNWCKWVSRCPIVFCRCRRWLHCPGWRPHRCVLTGSGWRGWSCMVQRRQLTLKGKGTRWIPIWISFRSPLKVFLKGEILIRIRFLLRLSWTPWILKDRYSCRLIFWFCPNTGRRSLFRWCNVLWRSCWRRLLFLRSIIRGGITVCRFRFWPHRWRWALSPGTRILVRVFRLRSLRKRCWKHHHLLRWSCLMAFVHQVGFRAQGRIVPSKRYQLKYQLIRRGLKLLLSFLNYY